MSKKCKTYEELLIQKQKVEELFEIQKALVKLEMDELKQEIDPALNVLEFLKKLTLRNKENPIIQSGLTLLIDAISKKTEGEHPGFVRSTIIPFFVKNVTSNLLAGKWEDFIHEALSLFINDEKAEEAEPEPEPEAEEI